MMTHSINFCSKSSLIEQSTVNKIVCCIDFPRETIFSLTGKTIWFKSTQISHYEINWLSSVTTEFPTFVLGFFRSFACISLLKPSKQLFKVSLPANQDPTKNGLNCTAFVLAFFLVRPFLIDFCLHSPQNTFIISLCSKYLGFVLPSIRFSGGFKFL